MAGIEDAIHAEYGATDGTPVVSLLDCSINGVDIKVDLVPDSRLARLHGGDATVVEHTTCNYGLNPELARIASTGGMQVCGTDELHEVRAVELVDHPFFVATLYQPQLGSRPGAPHPVFAGLVRAASG